MLNRSASLAMSTSVLKALPGKLDIKRHSPSILYMSCYHHFLLFMKIVDVHLNCVEWYINAYWIPVIMAFYYRTFANLDEMR